MKNRHTIQLWIKLILEIIFVLPLIITASILMFFASLFIDIIECNKDLFYNAKNTFIDVMYIFTGDIKI
ncbi:MAG: hypothetical protein LBL65_05015 [Campylobacteraceae bacterium]|jgi:ABC-type multidrug transport system permease subunit|nr:hypothetical protein [Campylobacteraceae bacterium]